MTHQFYIGIDCGKNTGFAIWDKKAHMFIQIDTLLIHEALIIVRDMFFNGTPIFLVIEDARKVRFGTDAIKAQGAGSVKRDATIWEDFCKDCGIPYKMVRPNKSIAKWDAERFRKHTGWSGRTSSHGRDAAMLVFGY